MSLSKTIARYRARRREYLAIPTHYTPLEQRYTADDIRNSLDAAILRLSL